MSILSEILSTGHVDKELLDALDDEQKQLLFCQMRAEQLRKWEAYDDELTRNPPQRKTLKRKNLRWLQGTDGEVWVWVMGDHPTDPTIDQILDEEARREAHLRALSELHQPGLGPEQSSFTDNLPPEEALKAQLGSMRLGVTDSLYDDADSMFDHGHPLLFQPGKQKDSLVNRNTGPVAVSTTVSSFSVPPPQKTEMKNVHVQKPPILPKPPQISNEANKTWQEIAADNGVKLRNPRASADKDKIEEVQKRESEIFQSIQEQRERIRKEAEAEADRRKQEWELQNKRAREAENAMREMAQKAREQHRQLIRTSTSILPALKDTKATSLREALKNLPRPPKPKSRQAIIEWFRRDELPRGTGLDPKTKAPALWFHGIITRDQAEVLLQGKPKGSFLVRVSERIWGYTVSYVVGDGSFKHFLIERIAEGYQFLGTNQVVHEQLFDLVSYHESAPITAKGGEILIWAVGQSKGSQPDYYDIIPETQNNSAPHRYVGRF